MTFLPIVLKIWKIVPISESPTNTGTPPFANSPNTQPKLHRSIAAQYFLSPSKISGARYLCIYSQKDIIGMKALYAIWLSLYLIKYNFYEPIKNTRIISQCNFITELDSLTKAWQLRECSSSEERRRLEPNQNPRSSHCSCPSWSARSEAWYRLKAYFIHIRFR